MTTDQLRAAYKAVPFRPFTLRMVDGRSHKIDRPEFFSYRPGTRTAVTVGPKGEFDIFDTMLIRELSFDQEIEPPPPPQVP
jgi:hypothetical protein